MTRTVSKAAVAAMLSLSLLTAGACSRTERFTATGAALGAGGGALIGAASGGGSVAGGAVVGGVVGGVAGYCIARDCLR